MKRYIVGFLLGSLIMFVIMGMVIDGMLRENARLEIRNQELVVRGEKLSYKLRKANRYNEIVTYNFNHYRIETDRELEELGKWDMEKIE